jgi:hypothetical protein
MNEQIIDALVSTINERFERLESKLRLDLAVMAKRVSQSETSMLNSNLEKRLTQAMRDSNDSTLRILKASGVADKAVAAHKAAGVVRIKPAAKKAPAKKATKPVRLKKPAPVVVL